MAKNKKTSRSWGGRFKTAPSPRMQAFTASIGFDIRLFPYDVRASIAHARMLAATKIISAAERDKIVRGLRAVEKELASGRFKPDTSDEDIHMAVERRLIEKIGAPGAKLHTARSRNDQVATDVRLFVKDAIAAVDAAGEKLQAVLVEVASRHPRAILPGYTHLQRAQPVLLGHHLLAYYDMLERDRGRLADCLVRADVLTLGSGALAGTTLPIDRKLVAHELGFARVCENSIDGVADRDFIVEFLAAVALVLTHLSRLANEITLWVSAEFGFAMLDDAYSTGSSMMPQKKNPDIAELVRGKSGRTYGNLIAVLTALKGLPLAYNSDLQEDKEPLFDSTDTALACLEMTAALLASLRFDEEAMAAAASDPLLLATDLAEHLVAEGVAFREAHEITGRLVRHSLETGVALTDMSDAELTTFCPALAGASALLDAARSIDRRRSAGGTSGALLTRRLRKLERRHARKAR